MLDLSCHSVASNPSGHDKGTCFLRLKAIAPAFFADRPTYERYFWPMQEAASVASLDQSMICLLVDKHHVQ